jgi:hypothetical protein
MEPFLIIEWHLCKPFRVLFIRQDRADGGDAEYAEKQNQGYDTEPLDTIDGLKQIFVHG